MGLKAKWSLLLDNYRSHDLVSKGLFLGVPKGEEVTDVARELVNDVEKISGNPHPSANELAVSFFDKCNS